VLDGGGEPGFAQYGGTELLCGEDAGAQDFEHDWALQKRVVCQVDNAAATCAQLAENLVMFDGSSLHLYQVYRLWRQENLKSQ
jgi:D-alanyl-D-alanine dipeptidase